MGHEREGEGGKKGRGGTGDHKRTARGVEHFLASIRSLG